MKKIKILSLVFPLLVASACKHTGKQAHSGHDHGHDHATSQEQGHVHNAKLYLTAYSDSVEFFAEADPLFIGNESGFLIQLSRLRDFKPLDPAVVRLRLEVNGQQTEAVTGKSVKPGMYRVGITPDTEGEGILHAWIETPQQPAGSAGEIRIPVHVYANEHEAHHAAEHLMPSGSNTAAFPKAQSYLIDFATEEIHPERTGMVIATVAQVLPAPGSQNEVIAKASGIVAFDGKNVTEGQAVEQGGTLFWIEGGGMMENNISQFYTKTVNEYEKARKEYERKKSLAEDRIVSETDLLNAKADYENAKADYENLRKNFSADRQSVRAPMAGYIKQITVQNGQYVEAGQPMATISQNRSLLIQAELSARYYAQLKNIREANIREMNGDKTYSLQELNGKLVSYGQSAASGNPLIPVIFEIDNVLDAIPGTFVNLYLKIAGETPRLSVANSAIVEEMGNYFVFVQLTPELFEKRPVIIGVTDGFRTEIKEGLAQGERVVSRGAQIIKLSQSAGALDPHAGHAH